MNKLHTEKLLFCMNAFLEQRSGSDMVAVLDWVRSFMQKADLFL